MGDRKRQYKLRQTRGKAVQGHQDRSCQQNFVIVAVFELIFVCCKLACYITENNCYNSSRERGLSKANLILVAIQPGNRPQDIGKNTEKVRQVSKVILGLRQSRSLQNTKYFFHYSSTKSKDIWIYYCYSVLKNKLINILNFITLTYSTMRKSGSHFKNDPHKDYHSVDQSKTFPLVPDEIHKVPESIRKALKVGKHKKNININVNFNNNNKPKLITPQKSNLLLDNSEGLNKKQSGLQVRQIFNFMTKCNYEEEEQKIFNEDQSVLKDTPAPKMFKSQHIKNGISGDRILYARKKLSPIKRGLSVQPRSIVTRNLKVTFLNVEKLELLRMCNEAERQKIQLNNKTSMAMTTSLVTKSTAIENFLQSTGLADKNIMMRRSFYNSPNKAKVKPFVPPFEKYHYRDFIWKCAFSYNIQHESPETYEQKLKVYIGKGNNSMLLKTLFKRRKGWFNITEKYDEANVVWTQIKINTIFTNQKNQKSIYSNYLQLCPEERDEKDLTHAQKLNLKILDLHQLTHWMEYFSKFRKAEDSLDETMKRRNKIFANQSNSFTCKNLVKLDLKSIKMHNHLPNNYIISNKKALFYTMSKYYDKIKENVFEFLPLTFHVQNGLEDPEYLKFLNSYYERAKKIRACEKNQQIPQIDINSPTSPSRVSKHNMWIVKPGQFTNRGNGITVCMNLNQIKAILKRKQKHDNGNYKTYIIQSYLEKPFLYQRRKFDLRHYMMITSINGIIKGYWYQLGYIRTTSFEYTTKHGFTSVHLTNDAVQKYLPEYGKYQKGNKISYEEFQKYLQKQYGNKYNFYKQVYPKMKKIATDSIRACAIMIDPEKKGQNFQVFGMDFMIDADFHPWLIQINNNPCLELSCPLLGQIIPPMVQNALKICVDSLIPPPVNLQERKAKFDQNAWQTNKFELVYNSVTQQNEIIDLFNGKCQLDLDYKQLEIDQDEVFDDDGVQLQD